ncbi:MAG: Ig-like domain-containing protein [Spirochaetaceae bacterium]|jgi:hypothetical protein|nr:Ig-like domain-containing protein [Spirochaetaceae bacterium]
MNNTIKYINLIFIVLAGILIMSCDVLRDHPFEVCGWLPGEGVFENTDALKVTLFFTDEPNRNSVEKSFSLTENGENVKGTFNWDGKSVAYTPLVPLGMYKDFVVVLTNDAETNNGLSLENKFEGHFSSKPEGERPLILSVEPENESIITNLREPVKIEFSEAVIKNTCIDEISFSPSMSGTWQISESGTSAVFYPKENWKQNETYILTISSYFKSEMSYSLGKAYTSRWHVGSDRQAPYLNSVYIIDKNDIEKFELTEFMFDDADVIAENENLEASDKIKLMFSEPVDISKVKSSMTISPSINFVVSTCGNFSDTIIIVFETVPEWSARYIIRLNSGIPDIENNLSLDAHTYRIKANGENSMPPILKGLRVQESFVSADIGSETIKNVWTCDELFSYVAINNTQFPTDHTVPLFFELYFETAKDAAINLFSLRDLFRIDTTNNCADFYATSITNTGFTYPQAAEAFSGLKRVEVRGDFKNKTTSGLIKFYISAGLTDTKQNKNNNVQSIQLTK